MPSRRFPVQTVRDIDGDTVMMDVDQGFHTWSRQRFRLLGVDTPERGEPRWKEANEFTTAWLAARHALEAETLPDPDSFDRWLAIIWAPDEDVSLNQALLTSGLAVVWKRKLS
jgi:micrococcal nuclease